MKKVFPILFLIVLFTLSYFAYQKVQTDDRKALTEQKNALAQQITDLNQRIKQNDEAQKSNENKLHDTLCVALPDNKKVIDGAFGRTPPTTAPAKVEK